MREQAADKSTGQDLMQNRRRD